MKQKPVRELLGELIRAKIISKEEAKKVYRDYLNAKNM